MKPLIVLIAVLPIAFLVQKYIFQNDDFALSARIALSAMLLFTAIGHFVFTKGMAMTVPAFIPYKKELVYLTGVIEIAAAIGLMIPGLRVLTAWLLILFFVLLLPSNIKAAVEHVDIESGTQNGRGLNYLWFRIPLQLLFIAWTYISAIKF